MFTFNLSNTDRVIRVVLGIILLAIALLMPNNAWASVGWVGVVPLATGLIGWCALYRLFGISTRRDQT